jgi:hypothetical protein
MRHEHEGRDGDFIDRQRNPLNQLRLVQPVAGPTVVGRTSKYMSKDGSMARMTMSEPNSAYSVNSPDMIWKGFESIKPV